MFKNKSLFSKLSSLVKIKDESDDIEINEEADELENKSPNWLEEDGGDGQLSVDVHQTPTEIIIKAMVAGVKPEDLDISITRDMVTIKGKREEAKEVSAEDYFYQELYWGSFSRSILLPQEVEADEAEASEKNGLLTITLPKLDKNRQTKLKVKN